MTGVKFFVFYSSGLCLCINDAYSCISVQINTQDAQHNDMKTNWTVNGHIKMLDCLGRAKKYSKTSK